MVSHLPISPMAPWFRMEVSEQDWRDEQARDLVNWYGQMLLVRRF